MPEVDDQPLWWVARAFVGIEGENEVAKRKQTQGSTQATIAEMHGGQ